LGSAFLKCAAVASNDLVNDTPVASRPNATLILRMVIQ
jgi:hypothetical protein